jgi:transposase-like protein
VDLPLLFRTERRATGRSCGGEALGIACETLICRCGLALSGVVLREFHTSSQGVQMTIRPCPECSTPSTRLRYKPSQRARSDYYRCHDCGHSWIVNRNPAYSIEVISERRFQPIPLDYSDYSINREKAMRVTLNCKECPCQALVNFNEQSPGPIVEALWRCPLCGHSNPTSVIGRIVSVSCQCQSVEDGARN